METVLVAFGYVAIGMAIGVVLGLLSLWYCLGRD